jgi:hypothetical protein
MLPVQLRCILGRGNKMWKLTTFFRTRFKVISAFERWARKRKAVNWCALRLF